MNARRKLSGYQLSPSFWAQFFYEFHLLEYFFASRSQRSNKIYFIKNVEVINSQMQLNSAEVYEALQSSRDELNNFQVELSMRWTE